MPRIHQRPAHLSSAHGGMTEQPQPWQAPTLGPQSWQLPEMPGLPTSFHLLGAPLAAVAHGQGGLQHAFRGLGEWLGESRPPAKASRAKRLRSALETLDSDWKEHILGTLLPLGGLLAGTAALLSPSGPGGCDHNTLERCANCATSVPYVLVGVHAIKNRKTSAGKMWGASMVCVGMASTTFHASSGKMRTWGRRMDYWSIAAASNIMVRSVFPNLPPSVTAAGIALTPFKPFLISFLNSTAMELKFLQRARQRPELRQAQQLHAATCLAGLGAFALEELFPRLPLVHSAWHLLSATAVATVNNLLDDVEQQHALKAQPALLTATCTPL